MFVSISRYRARPGEDDAIVALHEDWQRRVPAAAPGFLSSELLRSAGDPQLFFDIVRFESEEAARAHSRDPEQRAWCRRLASLSEVEPDTLDCSVAWWWTTPPNWDARIPRERRMIDPHVTRRKSR